MRMLVGILGQQLGRHGRLVVLVVDQDEVLARILDAELAERGRRGCHQLQCFSRWLEPKTDDRDNSVFGDVSVVVVEGLDGVQIRLAEDVTAGRERCVSVRAGHLQRVELATFFASPPQETAAFTVLPLNPFSLVDMIGELAEVLPHHAQRVAVDVDRGHGLSTVA